MDWAVRHLHRLSYLQLVNACNFFDVESFDALYAEQDEEPEFLTLERIALDIGTVADNSMYNYEFVEYVKNCIGARSYEESDDPGKENFSEPGFEHEDTMFEECLAE